MARPRVMISVAKVGSSDPRYPKARRAMLERKHVKFLETHDTTINVEVTEETRIIDSLERTRIQCTLKLRARVFGEWKTFPQYSGDDRPFQYGRHSLGTSINQYNQ